MRIHHRVRIDSDLANKLSTYWCTCEKQSALRIEIDECLPPLTLEVLDILCLV